MNCKYKVIVIHAKSIRNHNLFWHTNLQIRGQQTKFRGVTDDE